MFSRASLNRPRSGEVQATLDHAGGEDGKILVGVDGSEPSLHALLWAAGEARRTNQKLIAVHVQPSAGRLMAAALTAGTGLLVDEAANEACRELETLAQRVGRELDIQVEFRRGNGERAKELVRIATAAGAGLVVVGRSRRAFLRTFASVPRRLAGANDAPIVVVVP